MGIKLSDFMTDDLLLSDEEIYKSFVQAGYEIELNEEFGYLRESMNEQFQIKPAIYLNKNYANPTLMQKNLAYSLSNQGDKISEQEYITPEANKEYKNDYRQAA